jgi:hypothetical protein
MMKKEKTTTQTEAQVEYVEAQMAKADKWVAACGGNETWTTARNGRRYLYVFNPATGQHGWLNQSDVVEMDCPYGL